jgi:hypothetical protein
MYKYVAHYIRRKPSGMFQNEQTLTFDIWENELSDAWAEVIRRKLAQPDTEAYDYSAHWSFPAQQNKYELFDNISKNVEIARKLRPDLEWPDNINEIDQAKLNYLHERFHESQEIVLAEKENQSMIDESLEEVRNAFNKINHDIHSLENLIEFEARPIKEQENRQNYHVLNFGLYDGKLRVPLTNKLREEFWKERPLPSYKPVQLWLGYATVGKALMHCVVNNDPDVVRDGMVRPQIDIGGETLVVIFTGDRWAIDEGQYDIFWQQWDKSLESFMKQHDLYNYIDHRSPEHYYGKQPVLGMVANEHNDWTEEDYYRLFTEYKLSYVELIKE